MNCSRPWCVIGSVVRLYSGCRLPVGSWPYMQKSHRQPMKEIMWRSLLHAPQTPLGEARSTRGVIHKRSRLTGRRRMLNTSGLQLPLGWASHILPLSCLWASVQRWILMMFSESLTRTSRNPCRHLESCTPIAVGGLDAVRHLGLAIQD